MPVRRRLVGDPERRLADDELRAPRTRARRCRPRGRPRPRRRRPCRTRQPHGPAARTAGARPRFARRLEGACPERTIRRRRPPVCFRLSAPAERCRQENVEHGKQDRSREADPEQPTTSPGNTGKRKKDRRRDQSDQCNPACLQTAAVAERDRAGRAVVLAEPCAEGDPCHTASESETHQDECSRPRGCVPEQPMPLGLRVGDGHLDRTWPPAAGARSRTPASTRATCPKRTVGSGRAPDRRPLRSDLHRPAERLPARVDPPAHAEGGRQRSSSHADAGGYKPLNWMTPPTVFEERRRPARRPQAGGKQRGSARDPPARDPLRRHARHGRGGRAREGRRRAHLQEELAAQPEALEEGLRLVRREWPTDVGPVDLMCRDADDGWVAVEIKRVATIDAVEQLSRYLERIQLDPALAACRGVLAPSSSSRRRSRSRRRAGSAASGRSRRAARRARARAHALLVGSPRCQLGTTWSCSAAARPAACSRLA